MPVFPQKINAAGLLGSRHFCAYSRTQDLAAIRSSDHFRFINSLTAASIC